MKTNQVTKHVDIYLFSIMDGSSNLPASTNKL